MAKEPASAKAKTQTLPQTEVTALAKHGRYAWDTGEPQRTIDSRGDVWEFDPIRDGAIRLEIRRYGREIPGEFAQLLAGAVMTQTEFGLENADIALAAKINAVSDPA